ncbi:MAG TPA: pyridoxamine 5'-phosphate oxidase family protein [Acidimicrobiales bacterium]|nr:pyridoxamine 5'-phosphate oxidase family protein [Acidimicrobiales bacterium]
MSVTMSVEEREAFLADVHVGVLSVGQPSLGPLSVPVWYTYTAGGLVSVITGSTSRKARLIADAGRFSLCAQSETPPYKYVTVEGPVTSTVNPVDPDERRDEAHRYLGPEFGDLYLAATTDRAGSTCVIRMTPESWLTADFAKEYS